MDITIQFFYPFLKEVNNHIQGGYTGVFYPEACKLDSTSWIEFVKQTDPYLLGDKQCEMLEIGRSYIDIQDLSIAMQDVVGRRIKIDDFIKTWGGEICLDLFAIHMQKTYLNRIINSVERIAATYHQLKAEKGDNNWESEFYYFGWDLACLTAHSASGRDIAVKIWEKNFPNVAYPDVMKDAIRGRIKRDAEQRRIVLSVSGDLKGKIKN